MAFVAPLRPFPYFSLRHCLRTICSRPFSYVFCCVRQGMALFLYVFNVHVFARFSIELTPEQILFQT